MEQQLFTSGVDRQVNAEINPSERLYYDVFLSILSSRQKSPFKLKKLTLVVQLTAFWIRTTLPALGVNDITNVCVWSGFNVRRAFNTWNGPLVSRVDNFSCVGKSSNGRKRHQKILQLEGRARDFLHVGNIWKRTLDLTGRGLQTFLSEDHISCSTIVRGPDTLRNATVSGYVTLHQINKLFANILFFQYWENGFAGRSLETPGLSPGRNWATVTPLFQSITNFRWNAWFPPQFQNVCRIFPFEIISFSSRNSWLITVSFLTNWNYITIKCWVYEMNT